MTKVDINVFFKNINFLDNPIFRYIYTHFLENPSMLSIFILDLHHSFKKQNPNPCFFTRCHPFSSFIFFFQSLPFSFSLFLYPVSCSHFWLFPPFSSSSPFLPFYFLSFPLSLSPYPFLP